MVPAALLLALTNTHLALGLPMLLLAITVFEFAIVSAIPLTTEAVPGSPSRGMAISLGMGTLGRATASVVATRLYVHHGMTWPALMCAALASGMVLAMWQANRMRLAAQPSVSIE
jgi:predicted MFS family arabinose efflux permease